jgi:hypothetical protein
MDDIAAAAIHQASVDPNHARLDRATPLAVADSPN